MNTVTKRDGTDHCRLAGASDEHPPEHADWLSRPLCRRYVSVQFKVLHITLRDGGVTGRLDWHWALGMSAEGECEVLGAWRGGAATVRQIAEDLKARGVEHVRTISAEGAIDWALDFPGAVQWPLTGEYNGTSPLGVDSRGVYEVRVSEPPCPTGRHASEACSASTSQGASAIVFGPRMRRAISSAMVTAERMQTAIARAIGRLAPFADDGAAASFVMQALQRGDRGLFNVRPKRSGTSPRRVLVASTRPVAAERRA